MSSSAPFPRKRQRDEPAPLGGGDGDGGASRSAHPSASAKPNGARAHVRVRQTINLVSPSKNAKRSKLAHSIAGSPSAQRSVSSPKRPPHAQLSGASVPTSSSSSSSHLRMSSSSSASSSSSHSSSMSSSSASLLPFSRNGASRSVSSRAVGNKRSYASPSSSSSESTSDFARMFSRATTSSSYQDLVAGSTTSSSSKPFERSQSTNEVPSSEMLQQDALLRQRQNSPNSLLVSARQKGNPLLKYVRNVQWTYADILPDYVMGSQACAVYLSLRYHKLHPKYLHGRIQSLRHSFRVRVLLIHVDVEDNVKALEEITNAAFHNDWTLMCCWSSQEAARYLETFQSYENKPADVIKEKIDEKQEAKFSDVLNVIRSVNKTDVITLGTTFGTMAKIMQASKEDLEACPGLGPVKVQRIHDAFRKPFKSTSKLDPHPRKSSSPQMSTAPSSNSPTAGPSTGSDSNSNSSLTSSSSKSVSSLRAAVRSHAAPVITDAATGKIMSLSKS